MRHILTCLFLALGSGAALADGVSGDEMAAVRSAVQSGEALPLSVILPGVMALSPGEVLEVRFHRHATGPVYVISVLAPDWRIWTWEVDAGTGAVLNAPPERAAGKNEQS